jgi:HD-GYP domain-containing protein (c-di-GMP phosphodiesterase class II)
MKKAHSNRVERFSRLEQKYHNMMAQSRKTQQPLLENLLWDLQEYALEPRQHGERMAVLANQVGARMGLSDIQQKDLTLLAKFHDAGKILVPYRILSKAGSLTEEEWAEMARHPLYGYKLAMITPDIRSIADGILFHHERWDGHGYPHGLAGNAIPLSARIIAVVDAFDAMTHPRVFRKMISVTAALAELRIHAGSQFDPDIVDVFHSLFSSGTIQAEHADQPEK